MVDIYNINEIGTSPLPNRFDFNCLDMQRLDLHLVLIWDACNELFEEINHLLWDELSISYRVCECGCEVYYVHDEGSFFLEEVAVSSSGEPFEDACDDIYTTLKDAINEWCEKMNVQQGQRTDEEMMNFINDYEYEDDDTYFYIRQFTFE